LHELVLAYTAAAFAIGLLSGIWLGFRIVSRDAAMLATLDKRVGEALAYSSAAKALADLLEAQWADSVEEADRKRAQARAERQRADATKAKTPEPAAAPSEVVDLASLTPRERRRLIAQRVRA
jgi:hypothetical protein